MFEGICKNPFFIVVNVVIIMGQVLIITFGGSALSTTRLSAREWAISLVLGITCIPVAVLIRLIPDELIRSLFGFAQPGGKKAVILSARETPGGVDWFQALENVRCELLIIREPRSSRLQRLRREVCNFAVAKMFGERCGHDGEMDERTPLLERNSNQDRSRASSICGPPVVMAGLIAGGVAGWPRVHTPTDEA